MPSNDLYNEVADQNSKDIIRGFFEFEEWLLGLEKRLDQNSISKDKKNNITELLNLDKKELKNYQCFTFRGTNSDIARALCDYYGIDKYAAGSIDGTVYFAAKRGENEEKFRKMLSDVNNGDIDLAKIYEEWIKAQRESDVILQDDHEYDKNESDTENDIEDSDAENGKKSHNAEEKTQENEEILQDDSSDKNERGQKTEKGNTQGEAHDDEALGEINAGITDNEILGDNALLSENVEILSTDDTIKSTDGLNEVGMQIEEPGMGDSAQRFVDDSLEQQKGESKGNSAELYDGAVSKEKIYENGNYVEQNSNLEENSISVNNENEPTKDFNSTDVAHDFDNSNDGSPSERDTAEFYNNEYLSDNTSSFVSNDSMRQNDDDLKKPFAGGNNTGVYQENNGVQTATPMSAESQNYSSSHDMPATDYSDEKKARNRIEELRSANKNGITDAKCENIGSGSQVLNEYWNKPESYGQKNYTDSYSQDNATNNNGHPGYAQNQGSYTCYNEQTKTHTATISEKYQESLNANNSPRPHDDEYNKNAQPYNDADKKNGNGLATAGFVIDRLDLKDATIKDKVNAFFEMGGAVLAGGAAVAYEETAIHKGRHQYDSGKEAAMTRSYAKTAKHIEGALLADLTKRQYRGETGMNATIESFIKGSGATFHGFSSKSDGQKTLSEFGRAMSNRRLATKKADGTYDYTAFLNAAKKDPPEVLARKLGMVDKDGKFDEAKLKDLIKVAEKANASERAKGKNYKAKKDTTKAIIKKGIGDTEIYKGFMSLRMAKQRAYMTLKYTKVTLHLAIKTAAKAAYGATVFIPFAHKPVKNAKMAFEDRKEKREKEKEQRKIEKDQKKEERKTARREWLAQNSRRFIGSTRIGRQFLSSKDAMSQMWARMINSRWYTRAKLTKARISSVWNNLAKLSPLRLLDFKDTIKRKTKNGIKIVAAGFLLLMIAVIGVSSLILSIPTVATSFFSFELDDDEGITETVMGRAYTQLMKQQNKWLENMRNADVADGYFSRGHLKFTKDYISASEYASQIDHVVGYNNIKKTFTCNPFNFTPNDTSCYKEISKFDGGVEVYVDGNNSLRTCNLREILSMTQIYFDREDYGNDTDFGNESSDSGSSSQITGGEEPGFSSFVLNAAEWATRSAGDQLASWSYAKYATELFTSSHQEYIDLKYIILPTCYTDTQDNANNSNNSTISDTSRSTYLIGDLVDKCTEYDKGGCSEFKNFYYKATSGGVKIGLTDTNGCFHPLGDVVQPTSASCRPAGTEYAESSPEFLLAAYTSCPSCYTIYGEENYKTYTEKTRNKPIIEKFIGESMHDLISGLFDDDADNGNIQLYSTVDGGLTYKISYNYTDLKSEDVNVTAWVSQGYFTTSGIPVTETETGYVDIEGTEYEYAEEKWDEEVVDTYTEYWTETTNKTYYIRWDCHGGHSGRYCGGHLKSELTGVVYSFTDAQIGDITDQVIIPKTDNYISIPTTKTIVNNSKIRSATDIFDVDMAIRHSTENLDWEGWTGENMESALVIYNQDWEDIYGITIPSNIGGTGHAYANPFDFDWTSMITSYFGPRKAPTAGASTYHRGVDIGVPEGTQLGAICNGYVSGAGYDSSRGNFIEYLELDSAGEPTGYKIIYMHLSANLVSVGETVTEGQIISLSGNTGVSTGPHLHLAVVDPSGEYINPLFFVSTYSEPDEERAE